MRGSFGDTQCLWLAQNRTGENIKWVQVQMGHSPIQVILITYTHLMKETIPEAVRRTEQVIFEAVSPRVVEGC